MVKDRQKKVLIVGSIGRDHSLGWKLKKSPYVSKIFFAPGSAGTALVGINTDIDAFDFTSLIIFAKQNKIDLTVCSSDDVLSAGIVNEFQKNGLTIFGPTKEAAMLEASKVFAKEVMEEENIPTARFKKFTSVLFAKKYLEKSTFPIVIKASGLALGKGVVIAKTCKEAEMALDNIMVKKIFGSAGDEVVIEEFLEGREISIHAFSDGNTVSLFPSARDHKAIFDGNIGPNTGGMGTIVPVTSLTEKEMEVIKKTIVLPVIFGMKKRGIPFVGCLYPGVMMTKTGPKVLEFNARFGDPEMQSYMRLLQSDIFTVLFACAKGKLAKIPIVWSKESACCIVLASKGYPGAYTKGEIIHGLDTVDTKRDIVVFHCGTRKEGKNIVTHGGRVINITAVGKTMTEALTKAYSVIGKKGIYFNGMQYRRDIGKI